MMLHRVRCLLVKELAQLRRDKRLVGILLITPVIQLLVLGFAARTDVRLVALSVRDEDHSMQSREYVRALASSGYFRTTTIDGPSAEDGARLVAGRAGLVLVIPPQFGAELADGRPARVQALIDGADSNFAVYGLTYLQKATRLFSARLAAAGRPHGATQVSRPSVRVESRVWYNPDLDSGQYMVPGVMGLLVLVTTMLVTSMALVKEREEGTMEQLVVTPLRAGEVIAGKLLPFVAVGFAEITLAWPIMMLVFGVPLRGSLALFYLISGLFLLTSLGLGLFVSALVHTQQQAMLVATFFVMMPFVLLSGFIFPVDNMPPPIRAVAELIPLRHYLTAVRGIFLKGAGWHELWDEAAILLGWGIAILGLSTLTARRRLG